MRRFFEREFIWIVVVKKRLGKIGEFRGF